MRLFGCLSLALLRASSRPRLPHRVPNEDELSFGPLLSLLFAIVGHGAFDCVLREHRTVDLHGRKIQLFNELHILDLLGFIESLTLEPLCGKRRGRDGRAATQRLEFSVSPQSRPHRRP